MRNLSSFICLFISAGYLHAGWETDHRKQSQTEPGNWALHQVEVTDGSSQAEVTLLFFTVNKAAWSVVPDQGEGFNGIEAAVKSVGGVAGINGGYFESNLVPLGLLVSVGRTIHPLQRAKLLSGIFAIRNGRPELRRISEYTGSNGVSDAIQCGPFLVDGGHPVPGLNGSKVAARTFVFAGDSSIWGIGICRSVSLAQMSAILTTKGLIPEHRIIRALNLDGGSSTAFYAKSSEAVIFSPGLKAVSNYLVLREKP
jgi:hypothetical protein